MAAAYFQEFIALAVIHFLALISPGPDFAITVSQSVKYGRRAGIYTALGIGVGISIHVIYTVLGIGALMHASPVLMNGARIGGAIYLSYLALKLLQAQPCAVQGEHIAQDQNVDHGRFKLFSTGFLTNATNPKATLFFLAIFTTVVGASTPWLVQMIYGVWLCLTTALWFVFVALFFSNPAVREKFLRLGYWFERIMGALLLLFAARLVWGMFA